jgi:hypothetical protein
VRIAKVRLEILPVVVPGDLVHRRRGLRVQRPVGRSQAVNGDVVQERTQPTCTPVNASLRPRGWPTHDSGRVVEHRVGPCASAAARQPVAANRSDTGAPPTAATRARNGGRKPHSGSAPPTPWSQRRPTRGA